ncbi:hypothetical protein [Vibrio europaeus]|uniref:hypothetical protein n=1 Tax=Vibrio europaeus TaxID=300876 RepID=UPI00233E783A|nr:hypothetical protein [Vibrio europaeus]MDC5711137.1 hypothetical protein [Vibrio europaeus]MDC5713166.1 hypothetical protein [Vibrio europaeus]
MIATPHKSTLTISLCNLELELMVAVARRHYIPVDDFDFALEAIDIGLDLGNLNIELSLTMSEALSHIKVLDRSVYDAFVYAYNGALGV